MCKLYNCEPENPCHYCQRQAERAKKKPIKQRSDKRAKQETEYNKRVKTWKIENPVCMARLTGCNGKTTDCHHQSGRIGSKLLDESDWLPVCSPCHRKITDDSNNAIEIGLSKPRNKKLE